MNLINFLQNIEIDLLQLIINCCLLFCLAIIDIKKHKIYNHTIYFCFVVNFLYLILLHRDLVLICLIQSFICLAVLFLVYLKSKKIGAGDIKLLALVFFCYPFFVSIMVCLIAVVFGIIFILITKKEVVKFAPFIFIGNAIVGISLLLLN